MVKIKKEKKDKIKKAIKKICKKDASFMDDGTITWVEVVERIGQMQDPKFKIKAIK